MAISQNPVTGRMRQSFANVTATTWKGRNIIKAKVFSYNDRKTPAQENNRAKITVLSWAARAFRPFIIAGLRRQAVTVTEYNVFMSKAFSYPATAAITAQTITTLNPNLMVFSKGNLPALGSLVAELTPLGLSIKVLWDTTNTDFPADTILRFALQKGIRAISSGEEYAEDVDTSFNLIAYSTGVAELVVSNAADYEYMSVFASSASANDVSDSQTRIIV